MDWRTVYEKRVNWVDGSDLSILYHVIGAWSMDWRKMYKRANWIDGSDLWILYHVKGAWSMDWRKCIRKE